MLQRGRRVNLHMVQVMFSMRLRDAIQDLFAGVRRCRLWSAFATEDVLDTYRHTSVGAIWAVFSFSTFAIAIILVFGMNSGSGPSPQYIAHLVTGLLAWNFMSAIISQAPNIFVANERFLKGCKLPLSVWAFQATLRTLILNSFAAIGAVMFLVWYGYPKNWTALGAVPAVAMYVLASIPVQLVLGSLGAFTRDVQQIIENLMRAIFFLTPVIWYPDAGTHRATLAALNPLTPFIDIFRAPLIDGSNPWEAWKAVIAMTVGLWVVALIVFAYARRRIVFWL